MLEREFLKHWHDARLTILRNTALNAAVGHTVDESLRGRFCCVYCEFSSAHIRVFVIIIMMIIVGMLVSFIIIAVMTVMTIIGAPPINAGSSYFRRWRTLTGDSG